jgi:hypothetical protein
MRIIKPYGRSHVAAKPENRRRVLHLNQAVRNGPSGEADIPEFAGSHDELVIAQWISAIDKIASKPKQGGQATEEQRNLREALGDAAWKILHERDLLQGLKTPEIHAGLRTLWNMKIAPYDNATVYKKVSAKGRWYARFVGDCEPSRIDAAGIAAKIYEHLYVAEYRLAADCPNKRQGKIQARAESIAKNALSPFEARPGWTDDDEAAYTQAGDVAAQIHAEAERCRGAIRPSIAGRVLFTHYARVFRAESGAPLSIAVANSAHPGLFALHMAVKDCYARLLKDTKKKNEAILKVLPPDIGGLFQLIRHMGDNRDVNALIRLGKVIHYHHADRHSAPLDQSRYWGSDGQAEIKRNEAFVRVWRHVLSLAAATLTDWADPGGAIKKDDILLTNGRNAAMGQFDAVASGNKLALLFGNRAALFAALPSDRQKDILNFGIGATAQLRHSSFHFVGRGGFIATLEKIGVDTCSDIADATTELWNRDRQERAQRIVQTLRGAHTEYFFDERQNRKLYDHIVQSPVGVLPLPRFRRMLTRAEYAWTRRDALGLPAPANRVALENAARMCQYTALKLLYEHPFRVWLEAPERTIHAYIDKAVTRTTKAAQTINGRDMPEDERSLIAARAASLDKPKPGQGVWDFFFTLSVATATEMRVQRGYESDGEQARKQAEFIEELRCDVVALAFADFLKTHAYSFILALKFDDLLPALPRCDMGRLAALKSTDAPQDWQTALYFLLHLVPVDDVGKLLHQLRKWDVLAKPDRDGRKDLDRLMSVLSLYLDMHDAKFEGGAALTGTENFRRLFDPQGGFDRMFPSQEADNRDERVPRRGLREIMRFGHLRALWSVLERHRVTAKDIDAWQEAERPLGSGLSAVATAQQRREELHEAWVRNRRHLSEGEVRDYAQALGQVAAHRRLTAHVTLTDHVRLHRLMMAVLGRLVDFSGLWERDMYFIFRALAHKHGFAVANLLNSKGHDLLQDGRISDALKHGRRQSDPKFTEFWDEFERFHGRRHDKVRNTLAHLDRIRDDGLILTGLVNDTRRLMSYERKLKNAVAQSVIELLEREGLELSWTMTQAHTLNCAKLASRDAKHLGGVLVQTDDRGKARYITEALHGDAYVRMAAALFDGTVGKAVHDLTAQEIARLLLSERGRTNGKLQSGKMRKEPPQHGSKQRDSNRE